MWPSSQFADYLQTACGRGDLWTTHIRPQMERIVKYSMACAAVSAVPCVFLLHSCLACVMNAMVRYCRCSPSAAALLQKTMPLPQETLEDRGNSHELFGYDFVVDDSLNVWLIEVNCSPSLEHSTPVTGGMVTGMVNDLFKVGGMLLCSINTPEQKSRSWPVLKNPVKALLK